MVTWKADENMSLCPDQGERRVVTRFRRITLGILVVVVEKRCARLARTLYMNPWI